MVTKVKIGDVELILSLPDEIPNMEWIGGETYMTQLLASWILVDNKKDIPMNPQILGKPGVGKTTLAYSSAKKLNLPVYIFQCTVDTRPEDLLISPVIGENNTIKYHASSLVTAMIKGGICILDEANRMSEKSWASLAPLLDQRRYIESIIAGIKVNAHPNFRICCTMNEDSSTFEVPEYIHSRLQPQIFIDFPSKDEEFKILEFNLPFAKKDLITYTVNFLQESHLRNKDFTARDGINICRYYMKMSKFSAESTNKTEENDKNEDENLIDYLLFRQSVKQILDNEGLKFLYEKEKSEHKIASDSPLKKVFNKLMEIDEEDLLDENFEDLTDDKRKVDINDDDFLFLETEESEGLSDKKFLDDEDATDVIHIIEKKDEEEDPYENLDPFFIDELDDFTEKDPNEIVRKFLAKKSKKKSKKQKDEMKDTDNKKKEIK
uniref:AAA domain (Dynein-related subfamily) n=1 Tax=Promethearchaeum syntrophicum TaxID=2594042 RepID=A0A5B9D7N7_9ARCH|nr:AAA domain (dynein-related subfamily) [Candidatus Prometheoarchaeum syntrophicum]